MKKILLVLTGFGLILSSSGQEGNGTVPFCHTTEMQSEWFEAHPELRPLADSLSSIILKKAKDPGFDGSRKDGDPYIIPVVFHIIHEGGEENISFDQIQEAVQTMTDDFNGQNLFVETVNENFQDLIADVDIEFRLAQRDPEGNCTNGVVRTFNYLTNEGGENLKEISPIWDRSKYLNIWVCKTIASGAAGYTYYPSSVAGNFGETNDGIVVRYDYVGTTGTSTPGRGFVLAHEVGHWIDLPHLWGSTNEPDVEENCQTDDGVDDTPNTIGWTSCNTNGQSCGSLDNVENFMEYSFCSKMFTHGQKQRMLAALTSPIAERNNLWTEDNLIDTGVLEEPELCDAEFIANRRTICAGDAISFTDLSFSGVESRAWIFEGGVPALSDDATPEVVYNEPGIYTVSLVASDGNGNQMTEVKESFIQVLDTGYFDLPFAEGFESAETFEDLEEESFYTVNEFGPDLWEISVEAGNTGNHSAVFRATEAQSPVEESTFVSKTFRLSEVMENPVLTFKYAAARRFSNSVDELWVYISRNCGELWSLRKKFDDGEIYTDSGNYPDGYVPESGDWQTHEIDNIVSVFHNDEFRIKFEYRGQNGGTVYIDDINLVDGATLNTAYESAEDLGFTLYPNPAGDGVFISFSDASQRIRQIVLRDVSGRMVDTVPISNSDRLSEFYVDLSHYAKGLYLVEVQTDRGAAAKKLLID